MCGTLAKYVYVGDIAEYGWARCLVKLPFKIGYNALGNNFVKVDG